MAAPVFFEIGADGSVRTDGLHWEGFPRILWDALRSSGYTALPLYEGLEFEEQGVPCCRVRVTVPPHPDHKDAELPVARGDRDSRLACAERFLRSPPVGGFPDAVGVASYRGPRGSCLDGPYGAHGSTTHRYRC